MLTAQPVNSRDLGPRRGNLTIEWMIDRRAAAVQPGFFLWLLFFLMCTYTCMFIFSSPLTQSIITFMKLLIEISQQHVAVFRSQLQQFYLIIIYTFSKSLFLRIRAIHYYSYFFCCCYSLRSMFLQFLSLVVVHI